ncbi:MAG: PQQ-binding-like beta-propeller repeat protein [candidate division WOR-3 bacterium]
MNKYTKTIIYFIWVLCLTFVTCKKDEGTGSREIKWQFTGVSFLNSPALGSDGTIYAFGDNDTLYALNPDGSVKWRYGIPDTIWYHPSNIFVSPVIAPDGTIYLFAVDGNLYSLGNNGNLKWKKAIGTSFPTIYGTPALSATGIIYVYAPESLLAISPLGSTEWAAYVGGGSCITFPVVGKDGTIYIGADCDLVALNQEGSLKWLVDMSPAIYTADRLAIGGDNTVYVFGTGNNDAGNLLAYDKDGNFQWMCTLIDSDCVSIGTPVIGTDGTIYVGVATSSTEGWLCAVGPGGELRWKKESAGLLQQAYDLAIDDKGIIYTVDGAYKSDGTLDWRYPVSPVPIIATGSPAIGSDGTIYLCSTTGLFALKGTSSGLANSPWPRSRHDRRNSGNASVSD